MYGKCSFSLVINVFLLGTLKNTKLLKMIILSILLLILRKLMEYIISIELMALRSL